MNDSEMIPCREAIEMLWAYIDGELPEHEQGQVHDHLEACQACYPQYDFQRAFHEFVEQHMKRSVPPDLRRRVFLALLAEEKTVAAGGAESG